MKGIVYLKRSGPSSFLCVSCLILRSRSRKISSKLVKGTIIIKNEHWTCKAILERTKTAFFVTIAKRFLLSWFFFIILHSLVLRGMKKLFLWKRPRHKHFIQHVCVLKGDRASYYSGSKTSQFRTHYIHLNTKKTIKKSRRLYTKIPFPFVWTECAFFDKSLPPSWLLIECPPSVGTPRSSLGGRARAPLESAWRLCKRMTFFGPLRFSRAFRVSKDGLERS